MSNAVIDLEVLRPLILEAERVVDEDLRVLGSSYTADPSMDESMARYEQEIGSAGETEKPGLESLWGWMRDVRSQSRSALEGRYREIATRWMVDVPHMGSVPETLAATSVQKVFNRISNAFQSSQPFDESGSKADVLELNFAESSVTWVGSDRSFNLRRMACNAASDIDLFRPDAARIGALIERELRSGWLPGFETDLQGEVLRATPRVGVVDRPEPGLGVSADPHPGDLEMIRSQPEVDELYERLHCGLLLLATEGRVVRSHCILARHLREAQALPSWVLLADYLERMRASLPPYRSWLPSSDRIADQDARMQRGKALPYLPTESQFNGYLLPVLSRTKEVPDFVEAESLEAVFTADGGFRIKASIARQWGAKALLVIPTDVGEDSLCIPIDPIQQKKKTLLARAAYLSQEERGPSAVDCLLQQAGSESLSNLDLSRAYVLLES